MMTDKNSPKKPKQIEAWRYLQRQNFKKRLIHGGAAIKGRRKSFRPLSTKDPIHLVLKSSKAKGALSLRHKKHRESIHQIIRKQARKWFVQIRGYQNVGNHIHLEVKITARHEFQKFLKSVSAMIARKVTGARRGKKFGQFWDHLAFTRVLKTFQEHEILRRYFMANYLEAEIGLEARQQFLACWYG